jgi:hypothetical protein
MGLEIMFESTCCTPSDDQPDWQDLTFIRETLWLGSCELQHIELLLSVQKIATIVIGSRPHIR